MSELIRFFLEEISIKLDAHKLKNIADFGFIVVEKIVVKLNKLLPFYINFYEEMVKNEIDLAGISKNEKILHIGCGPIPATSILIAKKTGSQITGIDHNLSSVKQALVCVSKLNMSEKVQILHEEGGQFPIETFDLIIISQGIKPSNEVLRYISESMKNDARVIYRTSLTIEGVLSENDSFLKELFSIDKMTSQKQNGLLVSIVLIKK